jgi:hypothetical protein
MGGGRRKFQKKIFEEKKARPKRLAGSPIQAVG